MMNMIRPLAVLASLNAVVTVAASAQAFDEKHLCYEVVAEFAGIAGGNQAWGDAAALSTYAGKVRRELELFDWVLEQTDKQLDTAPLVQRNEILADLREINDCILWLGALLTRLESRLGELGVNSLVVPGGREHVAREKYFQDVRAELKKGETMLKSILGKHRGIETSPGLPEGG